MIRKGKRFLGFALACALVLTAPAQGTLSYAAENNAVDAGETAAPEKPSLPDGFGSPLEDNGGLTLADGAGYTSTRGWGNVIDVNVQWNNKDQYHATFKDVSTLKTKGFTVLFDVKQNAPSGDTDVTDQRAALNIGNTSNSIHLLTYSGKLGYGADKSGSGGVSSNLTELSGVEKDGWNAVAMTYEETDGNGHVIVYVNGTKAAEVQDIGFALSTMSDLSAMLIRSFNTNYLQEGRYDNIVVGSTVLDEETALAETAYRKYQKENPSDISNIVISGSDVDAAAKNINGLTYKGFGMLNGNSTSNLLLDYKEKAPDQYNEMMQYLFGGDYPLFTHIKMEMGNDGNNSTGAEACTMRYEDEEADASRSPGFVMAADAKKINPDVKISILRWEMPGWVAAKWKSNTNNEGYEAVYKWYRETIFDAYEKYGYVVDFVNPDKNETGDPDEAFIKWYKNRVANETEFPDYMDEQAREKYRSIRIIASDENKGLKIVPSMRADAELYDAVDIIGFHYRTNATDDYVTMADVDDKEVWYSEGCATFGYTELQENKTSKYGYESIGGYQSPLALMDSFITAFDSSRRTHYMFQPAVGSFYEGIQYGHKELLSARDPWSGYIHYDPALYMLEHFAKFAKTGWEDSEPDTNDIWRVISLATDGAFEGSENEHNTAGIDGNAGYMTLAAPDKSDFSVVFVNNTGKDKSFRISTEAMEVAAAKELNLWVTETDRYMQAKGTVEQNGNEWTVTIPAYSIATATTLDTVPERTPKEDIHNEDRAVLDTDETGAVNGVTDDNVLYADDFEYEEESEGFLEARGNEPRYMLDTHGAWIVEDGRLKHELADSVAQWNGGEPSTVVGDFRWMDTITSADLEIPGADSSAWARLTVRSQTGMNWNDSGYTFCINGAGDWELYRIGEKVVGGSVTKNAEGKYSVKIMALNDVVSAVVNGESVITYQDDVPIRSGRVKISSTWSQIYADNLLVETVQGGIPYALSMVDGQDDSVSYEGTWTIENPGGGSADNWYRTISATSTKNASFSFPVNGNGFAILGGNDGTAVLDVYVNDELVDENAATLASPARGETYVLSDLASGEYTVKVVVKSGTLKIDALYALGGRLEAAEDVLLSAKTDDIPEISELLAGESVDGLPEEIEVQTLSGKTMTKKVVWDTSEEVFEGKEFDTAYITGIVQDGVNAFGMPLTVFVPVGIVIPSGTLYYIDTVDAAPADNATTESYETVKKLLGGQLFNDCSDQLKTESNTWGLVSTNVGTKGYDSTADRFATGIYGSSNKKGETISYAFTLPAGRYTLVSGHREWWGHTRPMAASVSFGTETVDAGSMDFSGSTDVINRVIFTLEKEELVTYTLTALGDDAPVISWLAVAETPEKEQHVHSYHYTDNGDGTHTAVCKDNDDSHTEAHNYVNGICALCGAVKKADGDNASGGTGGDNNNPSGGTGNQNQGASGNEMVKPAQAVITGISNAKKGISVAWEAVFGAEGYRVYRRTGSGKWTEVNSTSATSWVDTSAGKNGTKYQYKVCAYNAQGTGEYSAEKTMYRLTVNNISGAKNVKGKKLALKWKKNAKASGYEIQYAVNNKFGKAKTVKVSGAKKTSKTISGLKKGKKYYVRIRVYKTSGKTKYYSEWSKVKKVRISK